MPGNHMGNTPMRTNAYAAGRPLKRRRKRKRMAAKLKPLRGMGTGRPGWLPDGRKKS